MLRDRLSCQSCLSICLSVCNVGVLWSNGWMDQVSTWRRGRPRLRRHCVRCGPSSPTERGTTVPHFSAHVCCGQTVAHLSYCWAVVSVAIAVHGWCLFLCIVLSLGLVGTNFMSFIFSLLSKDFLIMKQFHVFCVILLCRNSRWCFCCCNGDR